MKINNFKLGLMGLVIGSLSLGSCTDLDETVYSQIPGDGSYTMTQKDIQAQYGLIYDRMRDMYDGWEGYQDISQECADLLMTPFRYETSGWAPSTFRSTSTNSTRPSTTSTVRGTAAIRASTPATSCSTTNSWLKTRQA